MTTNLKFAYSDIPFNALSITSSETYSTDFPVTNLVNGSRGNRAELATAFTGLHEIEFDLGSGISQAADYIALADAKILKKSGVTQLQLKGSSASYRTPSSISGLVYWMDATKDVTYSSTRGVSQVSDQSGSGNHATDPASATNRPFYTRADNKANYWIYSHIPASYSANANISVSGNTITASAGNSNHRATNQTSVAPGANATIQNGVSYRMTFRLKYVNHQYAWVGDGADSAWHGCRIDLQNGTIRASQSVTSSSISTDSDGYRVVKIIYSPSATNQATGYVTFSDDTAVNGGFSYNAAGTEQIIIDYMQFNAATDDDYEIETGAYAERSGINGNRCLIFDGSNDYLTTASTSASGAHTAIVAFRTGKTPTGDFGIFGNNYIAVSLFQITRYSDGKAYYYTRIGGSYIGSSVLSNHTFYIAIGTWDGTTGAGGMKFYINGTLQGTTASTHTAAAPTQPYLLGSLSAAGSGPFNGHICEAMLFNSVLSDANRQAIEAYLTSKWSTAAATTIDLENLEAYSGGQSKDYISTFTETSACRYWIVQMESDIATLRPLSKLYFGKLFDLEREPQFERSVTSQRSEKQIYEKNKFSLEYKGISTEKRQEFEEKIGNVSDSNDVFLYTNSYNAVMLGTSLISCAIKDYSFESKGAKQNSLRIDLEETY